MFTMLAAVALTGCKKEESNVSDVKYSDWVNPTEWSGSSGEWYFDVNEPAITQEIIDNGVVLGYTKLIGDDTNVRPLPANTSSGSVVWNLLIPTVGTIEFTTTISMGNPSIGNSFRYIIIPGGASLKSAKLNGYDIKELKNMSYSEVCTLFGIPE